MLSQQLHVRRPYQRALAHVELRQQRARDRWPFLRVLLFAQHHIQLEEGAESSLGWRVVEPAGLILRAFGGSSRNLEVPPRTRPESVGEAWVLRVHNRFSSGLEYGRLAETP